MNRIVYVDIAGKMYPLNFSLGAMKAIANELGDINKLDEILGQDLTADTIDNLTKLIRILMAQGCAYKNMFEIDAGIPESMKNAAIDENGRYIPLSLDEIETAVGFMDFQTLTSKIGECIGTSGKTEVYADEGEEKNEKAPENSK